MTFSFMGLSVVTQMDIQFVYFKNISRRQHSYGIIFNEPDALPACASRREDASQIILIGDNDVNFSLGRICNPLRLNAGSC